MAPTAMETDSTDNTPQRSIVTSTSGSMREVVGLSLPLLVSFMSFSAMGIVDTFIMGRLGAVEQGAVGLGGSVVWLVVSFFAGTISAINTFVAQDHGAGAARLLRRYAYAGFALTPLFTLAIWVTIPLFPWLVDAMGTDAAVSPHVKDYVQLRLIGAPLLMLDFTISSFLRGIGDMRTPMRAALFANLVNAVLCSVLGLGLLNLPALGASGAALSTLIASAVETTILARVFFSAKNNRLFQTRTTSWPGRSELGRFLRVGLPIGTAWSFEMIAWTAFSAYAAVRAPADLAAHTIVLQLIPISCLPAQAVVAVATTLVGQYLGAKRPDIASRSARSAIVLGTAYMAIAGGVMAVLREPLVVAFNADPQVVTVGVSLMLVAALLQPFDAIGMVIAGVLRGAQDTRFPMLVLTGSGLFVFMPGVYLLGDHLGLGVEGAWIAALCHVTLVAALLGMRYLRGHWIYQ